jgi:hypothetical protein
MKKNKITLDDLANMVQNGFLEIGEKINGVRTDLKMEIKDLKTELKADIKDLKADLNKKVDIFTHKELEYRVEKLEKAEAGRKK